MSNKYALPDPQALELRRYPEGTDEYPNNNGEHDARLVDTKSLYCYGILFGVYSEDRNMQEKILRKLNNFDKLLSTLEYVKTCCLTEEQWPSLLRDVEDIIKEAKGV